MKQVIDAELYYLLKSKKLWIYCGIFAVCTAVNLAMGGDPYLDVALFVIAALLVSELMHKDEDKTTLKNIAGCGVGYKDIFRAKCSVVIIVCGSLLAVTALASLIYHLVKHDLNATAALLKFLTKLANYLLILIIGEFTNSIGGTIVGGILVTGVIPMFMSFMTIGDSFIAKICDAVYPYTLGGMSSDPLKTFLPKYLLTLVIIAVLLILSEIHYVKKHSA